MNLSVSAEPRNPTPEPDWTPKRRSPPPPTAAQLAALRPPEKEPDWTKGRRSAARALLAAAPVPARNMARACSDLRGLALQTGKRYEDGGDPAHEAAARNYMAAFTALCTGPDRLTPLQEQAQRKRALAIAATMGGWKKIEADDAAEDRRYSEQVARDSDFDSVTGRQCNGQILLMRDGCVPDPVRALWKWVGTELKRTNAIPLPKNAGRNYENSVWEVEDYRAMARSFDDSRDMDAAWFATFEARLDAWLSRSLSELSETQAEAIIKDTGPLLGIGGASRAPGAVPRKPEPDWGGRRVEATNAATGGTAKKPEPDWGGTVGSKASVAAKPVSVAKPAAEPKW